METDSGFWQPPRVAGPCYWSGLAQSKKSLKQNANLNIIFRPFSLTLEQWIWKGNGRLWKKSGLLPITRAGKKARFLEKVFLGF